MNRPMTTDNFTEDMQVLNLEGYNLSFLAPTRGSILPSVFDLERYFPNRLYWKWALMEKYTVDEPKLEELRAAGWEMIDHTTKPRELLHLTSQLGLVLALALPERLSSELVLWIRSQDLCHAEQYPVVLVYEAAQETPVSELVRLIPGTHAIIFEGEAIYRYEISQLGETGMRLLQTMMEGTHYASDRGLPSEFRLSLKPLKKSMQKKLQALQENMLMQFALAQAAAAQLSKLYWQLHLQSAVKPVRPPHSLMDIPPAFRQAHLYENGSLIPATDGLEAAIRAMTDAHEDARRWGGDRSKFPVYIHERATSTTAVTLRTLRMDQQLIPENEHAVAQQLWERVTTYSDNDGDVLLAMLAQVVAAGPDAQGATWITVQAILEYRGILPKRHEIEPGIYRDAGHRPEDMREVADCVGRLRDMHISVKSWREPRKPGGRRRKVTQESYLVLISDFLTQIEEGQTAKKEDALQIAWYYRPGSSLDVPLKKNAKVAWLLQQALRYDPYHEKWEKRLARYFMFQLRLNSSFGGTTIQRSIREILEESGLFSSINRTDPIRTKERFEKAMRTLTEHGHISDWGETLYLQAMEKRPARGWLEMWFAQKLDITAVPLIEDLVRDMLDQAYTQQQIAVPKKQRRKKED